MRNQASILHVDLDAFYAAVEQRDKPSLRGKPVVVGGTGGRGVVATASYEARRFGVRSAMSTAEARARCPHAAFLVGRFDAYRATSAAIMTTLRSLSLLVEPLSLDEAYVDLSAGREKSDLTSTELVGIGQELKRSVEQVTGGLTASVGIGSSKLVAKIASELRKPDGLVVVAPGQEQDLLRPMPVGVLPGVGPATAERLRRIGVHTVAQLEQVSEKELIRTVGQVHGASLYSLARAHDPRPVVAEREAKSISVEDTFEHDLVDPVLLASIVDRHARSVCQRLAKARLSGRTVTLKVRQHDFTTSTRSASLIGPTDKAAVVSRIARGLLEDIDTSGGVRLLGVGVSGLADWIQDDLFSDDEQDYAASLEAAVQHIAVSHQHTGSHRTRWAPGMDVEHRDFGPGWVWGSGVGRVTVRFETAATGPGPVRTFAADDPDLARRPTVGEEEPVVTEGIPGASGGTVPGHLAEPGHKLPAPPGP